MMDSRTTTKTIIIIIIIIIIMIIILIIIIMKIMGIDHEKTCRRLFEDNKGSNPACAYAQSDQCLYYSLFAKYHIKTCYKQNFTILANL